MIARFLNRRRRGAAAIMAIAAMIPTTAMFSANVNTAQMTAERRQTQDAADALAIMHGTWTARSLNVISANNVTTAQLLTLAVGAEALEGTLQEFNWTSWGVTIGIYGHAARECTPRNKLEAIFWAGPCFFNHFWVEGEARRARRYIRKTRRTYDPEHGIETAERALKAIEGMNRAIIERFPRTMAEIGREYAKVHGIDDFHFADPCLASTSRNCRRQNTRDGMSLPVADGGGPALRQMCTVMMLGTTPAAGGLSHTGFRARGFPIASGPMRHAGRNGDLMKHINDETRIGRKLHDFWRYYDKNSTRLLYKWGLQSYKRRVGLNFMMRQDRDNPNAFTIRYMAKYGSLCAGQAGRFSGLGPISPFLNTEPPTLWKLDGIDPIQLTRLARPEDMPDSFHILAYSQRKKGERLSDRVLTDRVEDHFGYAQTGVFNPDWADLFSPNWQFRLMPATRLDQPVVAGTKLERQGRPAFADLARAFRAVSDTSSWSRVHAH